VLNFTYAGINLSKYTASRSEGRYVVLTAMRNKFPNTSRYLRNLQRLQEYGNMTNGNTRRVHTKQQCLHKQHREPQGVLVRCTLRTLSCNTPVWHT